MSYGALAGVLGRNLCLLPSPPEGVPSINDAIELLEKEVAFLYPELTRRSE